VTQQWGVTLSSLSTALRTSLNIPANITGVVIVAVLPGGLADQAGLRSGDVIVAIDKTAITDMYSFFKAIDSDTNNTALLSIYSQGTLRYVSLSDAIIKTAGQPLTLTAGPSSSSADTTTATTTDTTTSTGSSPATTGTSANRPSSVPPPQAGGGPVSDTVLFVGLLIALILYLAYREFHRPSERSSSKEDY
ncbi:MAG: PDZ domain-containing protein, partial [Deltaproteobacteria bacterium]